ncbi:hypothetical protein GM3708_1872 [Geminocystis sp. NIES-3708]|uniref:hypothetical protein n=1 Tax=Geminocystis sp. NIES-3708 TaxID=1615909 RepID=UPI0005FCA0C1|nr:hypothetical protein [Geminocystis sp. NIES-3708]BAQ61466.1 hypothetical protein GM3708_1872 [Geminocystis sp. NIES-3708]
MLNKVISKIQANTRQKWHDRPEDKLKRNSINIDVNKLIKQMKSSESLAIQEQEIMKKIPHLKIIDKNNLLHSKEHQNTANIIFDYLGLQSVSVTTKMKKVFLNSV